MNTIHLRDVLIRTDNLPPIRSADRKTANTAPHKSLRLIGLACAVIAAACVVGILAAGVW